MTRSVAVVEATRWGMVAAGLALGLAGTWIGWRTWTGRFPGAAGPRPPYQSYLGASHSGLLFGPAFTLLALGELLRGAFELDTDSALYWAFSLASFGLLLVGGVYFLTYFWLGMPPSLRPPYQREHPPLGPTRDP